MAALAGVMIMVSIGTFDWSSLRSLHKLPKTDAAVMMVTVATVVVTHDLSKGVLAGVLLSAIFFAAKISKVKVTETMVNNGAKKVYQVHGQIFFASVSDLPKKFNFYDSVKSVEIDLSNAHLWDDSAIGALDRIETKFEQNNIEVRYTGLNEESRQLKNKIGGLSKASGH
jgi:sulfate permease, SulP family